MENHQRRPHGGARGKVRGSIITDPKASVVVRETRGAKCQKPQMALMTPIKVNKTNYN